MRVLPLLLIGLVILTLPTRLSASSAQPMPRYLEFDVAEARGVESYLVEVFRRGDDVTIALPVDSISLSAPPARNGLVRISLDHLGKGLQPGDYVMTVSAITAAGRSPRSAPSPPFAVPKPAGQSDQAPTAPQAPTPEDNRDNRLALIIGVIIGAAALLIPVFLK